MNFHSPKQYVEWMDCLARILGHDLVALFQYLDPRKKLVRKIEQYPKGKTHETERPESVQDTIGSPPANTANAPPTGSKHHLWLFYLLFFEILSNPQQSTKRHSSHVQNTRGAVRMSLRDVFPELTCEEEVDLD